MPEITTVERVRDKLREFDERVEGAIAAAKTLARVKSDAEKLLTEIQNVSIKSEQSHQKAEAVRLQFQQLQSDWEAIKQQVDKAQAESKETREFLLSELDAAIQSLGSKVG
jgi:DNA repair exonuclease SbcCD ATPase subunit